MIILGRLNSGIKLSKKWRKNLISKFFNRIFAIFKRKARVTITFLLVLKLTPKINYLYSLD